MEGKPRREESPSNRREGPELPFDQQLALAKVLLDAVDKRNRFTEAQGGFDTFAEVGQHVGNMRAVYDEMDAAALRAREEFDEKVLDKKEFVRKLKDAGEHTAAGIIAGMFSIPGDSVFRRMFRR